MITLFLTNICNLRCLYCYDVEKPESAKFIDLDFAKAGITDFFASSSSRSIRFFGSGEPTLSFSRMVAIREFAELLAGDELYVELQTNGAFNDRIASWIGGNVNMVWISCDGTPDIQDFYRPGLSGSKSSVSVERNMEFLAKRTQVGVRATIGSFNVGRQKEMIDYFASLGVKAVSVYPIFMPVSDKEKQGAFKGKVASVDAIDFCESYIEAFNYANSKGLWYGSILTANFDEPVDISCRAMLPAPHLTPDGFVSCCDMAYDKNTRLFDLVYGVYQPETKSIHYSERKIEKIRSRTAESLEECIGCEYVRNCAGGCVGEALNETGSMFRIKRENCEITKYLAERLPRNTRLSPFLNP